MNHVLGDGFEQFSLVEVDFIVLLQVLFEASVVVILIDYFEVGHVLV